MVHLSEYFLFVGKGEPSLPWGGGVVENGGFPGWEAGRQKEQEEERLESPEL